MRQIKLKPHYDLVIIGGGIQGCAMLWEAQSRGLNTLLVEANDYCSQTSANSLKTIHGGIRYLQTLNLPRTWRSCKEQETLLRIAPHLVHPLFCLLPTDRRINRSSLAVSAGFGIYNLLKKRSNTDHKLPKAVWVSKSQLSDYTDLLDRNSVTGAGLWYDAQVQHTERLGLAFVKTAMHIGADACNYLSAVSLKVKDKQLSGIKLMDNLGGQIYEVKTDGIICCAGADTGKNLKGFEIRDTTCQKFCLAINLVINKPYANLAIGLDSGFATNDSATSKRLLFAAPWQKKMLFGTWYFKQAISEKKRVRPTPEQIAYCLSDINATYPGASFNKDDIGLVHAGLLPVNGISDRPEKKLLEYDMIRQPDHNLNLFTVIPTKYTTCRIIAEKTISQVSKVMKKHAIKSCSENTALSGADMIDDFNCFVTLCHSKYKDLFAYPVLKQLATNYGAAIEEIAEKCREDESLKELIPGSTDHIKAQLYYALEYEQVYTLDDFIIRRTNLGNSYPSKITVNYLLDRMAKFYNLNDAEQQMQIKNLLENYPDI